MLERWCPALYGYLVWGGGFRHIKIAICTFLIILCLMLLIGFGYVIGKVF